MSEQPTKITALEIENVKRVKAVAMQPSPDGLTVIGGKNGQGKTSVLDAIAWALGGEKFRPSEPQRDGSALPPSLHIELSNGLIVERKGKNSDLKVTDPRGGRAGQTLLNEFISQFALDLPRFMQASSKDKALTLLNILGIGDKLAELERQETTLYNRRLEIGRIADQKKKFAAELPDYPDAPSEPVSASELIRQQQDILARNGENQRKRQHADQLVAHAPVECVVLRLGEIPEAFVAVHDLRTRRYGVVDAVHERGPEVALLLHVLDGVVVLYELESRMVLSGSEAFGSREEVMEKLKGVVEKG